VEYVNYSLVFLAMLIAFLVWLQLPSRTRSSNDLRSHADTSRKHQTGSKEPNQSSAGKNNVGAGPDLSDVPTPWGWPHYEKNTFEGGLPGPANGHAPSISDSFHHWADRLVQGKHTVDDEEYRRRREVCMRTLVEDRYGRSATMAPTIRAKRSGVPMPPHDQMDNLSGGRADKIEARLLRKGQTGEFSLHARQLKLKNQAGLKNMKMPWGW